MTLTVQSITIPAGSTIGYAIGVADDGTRVRFVGDQRPMRDVGEALRSGEEVQVEVEAWQIIGG